MKLTIAGIGPGSHLGYIVPGTSFNVNFKLVTLDPGTIERNIVRNEHVADFAMTVGPAEARKSGLIIVDAFGAEKGDYLFPAIFGPVTPDCPASMLQTVSERVLFMVDTTAAARVQELAAAAAIA